MELWLALYVNPHPLTPGALRGGIFLKDTRIYIDLLILGNTAITLLQQSFPSPPQ